MKPLDCSTYIKNNHKRVLPSFICTIISVFLVYLFGLLLYGSVDSFYKSSINLVDRGSFIMSNNKGFQIKQEIINEIQNDSNVSEIIPTLGMNNQFNYAAAFGSTGVSSFIIYSEDILNLLKNYNLELVQGTIPKNNMSELLLPIEIATQYKLKVGDYLDNETNDKLSLNKTYKLVGITKGDVWMPIVSDVGTATREEALKYGLFYFFKDKENKELNQKILNYKDKNLVIQEYKSMKEEMKEIISSIDFLYISLSIIILLVLCISLGNLNYIVFQNRKNEFAILSTIGFSKGKLKRKLFKENSIICFAGFIIGIGITTFVGIILNIAVWNLEGKNVPIFRLDSLLVAFIIPIAVSILSMISSVKELNKINYESLS